MSVPRVLVVDDQYARDATEWALFLSHAGLSERGANSGKAGVVAVGAVPLGDAWLCSGQREHAGRLDNDYEVIREEVRRRGEQGEGWSLVLLDVGFDSGDLRNGLPAGLAGDSDFGETVRQRLAAEFPDLPVVMLTGKHQRELGDCTAPYLCKHGLDRRAMQGALLRHGRLDSSQVPVLLGLSADEVVEAPATLSAFRDAFIHAVGRRPILVLGESGTGKEVLACYVYRLSGRKGPFVARNMAAIPHDLVESTLFGTEKGSYTGAVRLVGVFEQANGGTLFLDEIGEMTLVAQAKILRALQERKIYRIGGTSPIEIDINLVCATSRDPSTMIAEGKFREDLYHRINAVSITLPPLRERPEDIEPLARRFLVKAVEASGKVGIEFSDAAFDALRSGEFSGNVRQLENVVYHLATVAGNNELIGRSAVGEALGLVVPGGIAELSDRPSEQRVTERKIGPLANARADRVITGSAKAPGKPFRPQAEECMAISLASLPAALAQVHIDSNDPAFVGIKTRLDDAYRTLLQRLAGAALEYYRDTVKGNINRQGAIRHLTGDPETQTSDPKRIINEILGRPQKEKVTDGDIEMLINLWRDSCG